MGIATLVKNMSGSEKVFIIVSVPVSVEEPISSTFAMVEVVIEQCYELTRNWWCCVDTYNATKL